MGVCTGRRTYILPHARASSRRGHDPDGSSGNGPYLMDPLVGIVPEPSRRPTHGRARSLRMRSRQVEGGIRLKCLVLDEGREGGTAQAGHAADRRWSDAGGCRPDQGRTHR
ncbi:hypothetical protein EVAR_15058_1 [Eumeta japonica]|uniref:Uncharacterized protein n=1 Tax=Eumeta variegata TaxID=151549 RepID=A0A4C1YMH0_EUMVA|nr:hypothetical protein EVAR_15058_1 [Eumeta japonica]